MIRRLFRENRGYDIGHRMVADPLRGPDRRILDTVIDYADSYFAAHGMAPGDVVASYERTVRRYVADIMAFAETGKYPAELKKGARPISRTDYDVFLLLTILLTKHRFSVMRHLSAVRGASGKALVIGVGSGVELKFIAGAGRHSAVEAYDLSIDPFVRRHFRGCAFHREPYRGTGGGYGAVYAIELLEHLRDPYALLSACHRSLAAGGLLVTTTAVNVPQFDHVVNFSARPFEAKIKKIGFALLRKTEIPHDYPFSRIGAKTFFYVLRKK